MIFDDARSTLGQYDGSTPARAYSITVVVAQWCFGFLKSFMLDLGDNIDKDARRRHLGEMGFDDQHSCLRWLQDSAAGLDLSKESAVLFRYGVGG